MNAVTDSPAATLRTAVIATAAMLGLQALCSMSQVVPSVLAPVAAMDLRLQASGVGVMIGLSYLGGMVSGLGAGVLTAHMGAWRACQLAGVTCVLGLLGMALAGGIAMFFPSVPALLLSLLLIASGLGIGAGIGLINPVGSQILFHASPAELRSLIFSVKQTGVPIGAMLAGTLVPVLLLLVRWELASILLAAAIGAYVLFLSLLRLDGAEVSPAGRRRNAVAGMKLADFSEPVKRVWSRKALREMGIVSVCLSSNQIALTVFLVSYLKLEIGLSLVTAGLVFAFTQAAGVAGRIAWGVSADRLVTQRMQLGLLGIIGGASAIGVSLISPSWAVPVIAIVCAVSGATAMAWNGVFLSELAAISPPGEIATVTGGTQVFMFVGALGGPALFSLIVAVSGTYAIGFAVFAVAPMLAGTWLLARRRAG